MAENGFASDLIYDVGLHKGEDSEFYLKKGFRVVAIEALPALAEAAASRLRRYVDSGQLVILNAAVAEEEGPLDFFATPGNSVLGTTNLEWAKRNKQIGESSIRTTVQGVKFSNVVRQYGIPYFLKVDIEGADLLCLKALKNFDPKPRYISIESTKTSWNKLQQEFTLLQELGYSKFKVVPQHEVELQHCPFPAKEGKYADHNFEFGSSGMFGEEAPGDWLNEAEALHIYRPIFRRYKLFGDYGVIRRIPLAERFLRHFGLLPLVGWYDTHAAKD